MRARRGLRFVATTALLVAARALDAWSTWVATPDLRLETNPLQRLLHFGWGGLLLMNAVVIAILVYAAWRAAFRPPALPTEPGFDLPAFIGHYWFSSSQPRSLVQATYWLPADRRVRWAFIGGPGAALVIAASALVAVWNLAVARGVVISPRAGHLWVAAFWVAVLLGLGGAVRLFLVRAYTRYSRYSRVAHGPAGSRVKPAAAQ